MKHIKVSRATASSWVNGKGLPIRRNKELVRDFLHALRTAECNGEIPVPKEFKLGVKDKYMEVIIRKYMEGSIAPRSN